MDNSINIPAIPAGFVMVNSYGDVFLKADEKPNSPRVGGDAWEVVELLNFEVGHKERSSFWEVRRDDETTITFKMIDPKCTVDWGVPLKMSISLETLEASALHFHLI